MKKAYAQSRYRRFIPDFANITAPITELLKKGREKIEWNADAQQALGKIKTALTSAPVLANPGYSLPFIIQTDASDTGMGAILVQGEGDAEKVVAYWSRKLSAAQRKYQTTERECLAVISAVEKFRPYIEGAKFTVITDHASLVWLRNLKDPTGRLGRWALRLQPYDFTLIHRKGKFMVVADALSRAVDIVDVNDGYAWYGKIKASVQSKPDKFPQFAVRNDTLYKHCSNGQKGVNYLASWREVVPMNVRPKIMQENHSDSVFKTIDRIKRKYYWPKMYVDIRGYISACEVCKACKPTNEIQRSPMGKFRETSRPWELIYIDFIGPLPHSKSGFTYMLVVVDAFTKFVYIHPLRKATT